MGKQTNEASFPASIFRGYADKKAAADIASLYGNMPLKRHFRTYSNVAGAVSTIVPVENMLADLVGMMPFLGRPLYVPGVGLFEPGYPEGEAYSFLENYRSIPFSKRGKRTNFLNSVLSGEKLSYERFYTLDMIHMSEDGRQRFIRNEDTKNAVMSELVGKLLRTAPVGCVLTEPYEWPDLSGLLEAEKALSSSEDGTEERLAAEERHSDELEAVFAEAVGYAASRKEDLASYLSDVDASSVLVHPKIMEDVLYLSGFAYGLSVAKDARK